jgi:hypothetical protein
MEANTTNLRAVTLGKASTVHASEFSLNAQGRPDPQGYPLCGQAQGRHGQGLRPVNHKSYDLTKVTCAKCATIMNPHHI